MNNKTVVVVGGGASGILSAIICAKRNNNVILIEKNDKLGKKLLATGNGRCNLTNAGSLKTAYNCDLTEYFDKFNNNDTINLFQEFGLVCYADEQQRVYPISNSSNSVLDILKLQLKKYNVQVELNCEFVDLIKQNNNFVVKTNTNDFCCDNVIFSCGGNTLIKTAQDLGAQINPVTPSLCSLQTESCKKISGLRLQNVNVTLSQNDCSHTEFGEVLFKDSGLSGICIFNLSTYLARTKNYNAKISIDLLPDYSLEKLTKLLLGRCRDNANLLLTGMFHYLINAEIIKRAKINAVSYVTNSDICKIANIIKNFDFNVCGYYENNQVSCGGVKLECLSKDLQLKTMQGVFFTGEICDVDGLCGGYNLQWAWTSAYIVSNAI